MKYIGKNSISFIMEIILLVIMVVNIVVVIFLPQNVSYYLSRYTDSVGACFIRAKTILLIVLYPCGIFSFIVEFSLRKMFRTLVDRDPFVQANVKSLKTMGFAMVGVTLFLIVKIILLNSLMTMIGAFASILLASFCFVLADVFQQAVYYKQDNELTI